MSEAQGPPPPPRTRQGRQAQQVTEWPATSDEVAVVRQEMQRLARDQQEFRAGLVGSQDFPGGKLKEIQDAVTAAETHRADDVKQLHGRLDQQNVLIAQMPDVIVAKINGTYERKADFAADVDARIKAKKGDNRLAILGDAGRFWLTVLSLAVAGAITYLVTAVLPHIK